MFTNPHQQERSVNINMLRVIIALVSGILMGLAAAPLSIWVFAWVALVPLWILLIIEQKSLKKGILLALAWGFGYHGIALFWITGVHPMTWMGVPWLASLAIALFCWLFIAGWGAALVVIWSVGIFFLNRLLFKYQPVTIATIRVLVGVALWCGLEMFWSQGSLWWTSLSYTQSPDNLWILQLGQISGPATVTASIVLINGLLAEIFSYYLNYKNNNFKLLILPISIVIILHLFGYILYLRPVVKSDDTAIKVGIIQGNIPNEIKLYPEGWRKAIEGYTSGYKTLADQGVDIVLTPETALPFFWGDIINNSSFYRAILEKKVPAWLGAFASQGNSYTNSLFTVTGEGKIFSRYDKINLVPLGEYIPFEGILGGLINRLSPLDAHLVKGKTNQVFNTPFGIASVGICYDSAFAEHFRRQTVAGGQFIITAANNAHYSKTMPAQHHAQDVMRAIESDRWMARATNTGYSAIVDPRGRTLWISGINTYEVHTDTIYRRQTQTLYVKWGDWLTKTLVILAMVTVLISIWI